MVISNLMSDFVDIAYLRTFWAKSFLTSLFFPFIQWYALKVGFETQDKWFGPESLCNHAKLIYVLHFGGSKSNLVDSEST